MSNDFKFWLWRFEIIGMLLVDGAAFTKAIEKVIGQDPHAELWIAGFFGLVILTVPIAWGYTMAKQRRWSENENGFKDIETLQAYARSQKRKP